MLYDQMWGAAQEILREAENGNPGAHPIRPINGQYELNSPADFGFLQLEPRGSNIETGQWKFHISVDTDDVPRAWDIVAEELMQDGPDHLAKVVKPDTARAFANPDSIQAGKMITIYENGIDSPQHYQDLLARIEKRLTDAGIKPGPATNADRAIPGSRYSSYRMENDPNGRYMASKDLADLPKEQRFNPYNSPDPYKNADLGHVYEAKTPRLDPSSNDPRFKVYDAIEDRLGRKNVEAIDFRPNGDVHITVPDDYSRSNLAALGIDDPSSLRRTGGAYPGTAEIVIPKDRMPSQFNVPSTTISPDSHSRGNFTAQDLSVNGKEKAFLTFDNEHDARAYMNSMTKNGPDNLEVTFRGPSPNGGPQGASLTIKGDGANDFVRSFDPSATPTPKVPPPDIDVPKGTGGLFGRIADGLGGLGKHAGVVGGVVIGGVAGGIAMVGGASRAEAAELAAEAAIPYGETIIEGAKGNYEQASRAGVVETASNVASLGGMAVGAVVGQILIPIPGVGAVVGMAVGGMVAGVGAAVATNIAIDAGPAITNAVNGYTNAVDGAVNSAAEAVKSVIPKPLGPAVDAVGAVAKTVINPIGTAEKAAKAVSNAWNRINPFKKKDAETQKQESKEERIAENKDENAPANSDIEVSPELINSLEQPQLSVGPWNPDQETELNVGPWNPNQETKLNPLAQAEENDTWQEAENRFMRPAQMVENKGIAASTFGRATEGDTNLMKTVYKPEPGSKEHHELEQLVDRKTLDGGQDNPDIQQYAKLNDTMTLG